MPQTCVKIRTVQEGDALGGVRTQLSALSQRDFVATDVLQVHRRNSTQRETKPYGWRRF